MKFAIVAVMAIVGLLVGLGLGATCAHHDASDQVLGATICGVIGLVTMTIFAKKFVVID